MIKALLAIALTLSAGGCGYEQSSSPYGLSESLTLSVPPADNQSGYADLGPRLTRSVIARLDSAAGVTVRAEAPARLRLAVLKVAVSGGAWNPARNEYDLPSASASRVVGMTVEAILERPAPGAGPDRIKRRSFSGSRAFYVNEDENQARLLEDEAWVWLATDLAQKIVQTMFSEF